MKRLIFPLAIGVLALTALLAALSSQPVPALAAAARPTTVLPRPTCQTTFSVSCGETTVDGPCAALCLWTYGPCLWQWVNGEPECISTAGAFVPEERWKNQTHLYASYAPSGSIGNIPIPNIADYVSFDGSWQHTWGGNGESEWDVDIVSGLASLNWDVLWYEGGQWPGDELGMGVIWGVDVISQIEIEYSYVSDFPYDLWPAWSPPSPPDCQQPPTDNESPGCLYLCESEGGSGCTTRCPDETIPTSGGHLDIWTFEDWEGQAYPPGTAEPDYDDYTMPHVRACQIGGWQNYSWIVQWASINGTQLYTPTTITNVVGQSCTITQSVTFFNSERTIAGKVVAQRDYPPKGLAPFVNGTYMSLLPLDSIDLVYELGPRESLSKISGTQTYTWPSSSEKHVIAWTDSTLPLTVTPPFSVPVCTEPLRPVESQCPMPGYEGQWWEVGNWVTYLARWVQWVGCVVVTWYAYFDNLWRYLVCVILRAMAIEGNYFVNLWNNVYVNISDQLYELLWNTTDFNRQFGAFMGWLPQDFVDWLHSGWVWAYTYYETNSGEATRFVNIAIPESSAWLADLLDWVSSEAIPLTIGRLSHMLTSFLSNLDDWIGWSLTTGVDLTMQVIGMLLSILSIFVFLTGVLYDFIVGLLAALNSDTTAEIFTSFAPQFWRGLELFDELVGETPLVALNAIALGLTGFGLIFWTFRRAKKLFVDLMNV